MSSKSERLRNAWHRFDEDHKHKPTSTRQAVEWAVSARLLELPEVDPYDVLAGQMAQALRDEVAVDRKGRRYRVNHAVRITKGGVQHTFWAVMGFATHEHMEKTFAQRREQIIGDCYHLKVDVDVYNELQAGKNVTVQMILDFSDDVAEREQMDHPDDRAA
jgi:hypothetical protein